MRVLKVQGDFKARAIAGTRSVLIALDCADDRRQGLLGFSIRREIVGSEFPSTKWLRSRKVFKSVVANPQAARDPHDPHRPQEFSSLEHPIQSFLWGDDTAQPDTAYKFTVVPMYGQPGALEPASALEFEIRTEKECDQGHGIWFNRGAIAGQAFADEFQNRPPADPDDPARRQTAWLSRGLLEACLRYINETPPGDGLRLAAYELTYKPVLEALKAALNRGVNVRIVYHDTTKEGAAEKGENEAAFSNAGLPDTFNNTQVLFPRTKTKFPHNKFIVRLQSGTTPVSVWTGSTDFTASGFLGQTNVGHLIQNGETAKQYLSCWELLRTDPDLDGARRGVVMLTPNPAELIPSQSVVPVFSPRPHADFLSWYARRIANAEQSVMFTAAFGASEQLIPALARDKGPLRFLLLEKPPTDAVKSKLSQNHDLSISSGALLGEMYEFKNGEPVARRKIKDFELDKWYLKQERGRRANDGFVYFVHAKFLLIDPLSDDPLVCSGSANFSSNSVLQNDENMLLIRGNTRVADIYLTEFDRIFRDFYFRDVANEIEARGDLAKGAFLEETDSWTAGYFQPGGLKTRRRKMFFATPGKTWSQNAAVDQAQVQKRAMQAVPAVVPARPPVKPAGNKPVRGKAPKKVVGKAPPKAGSKTGVGKKGTAKATSAKPASKTARPTTVKKSIAKKAPPNKTTLKKAVKKQAAAARPSPVKRGAVKKSVAKKGAVTRRVAKKAVTTKKTASQKGAVKRPVVKKTSPKKAPAKKQVTSKGLAKQGKGTRKSSRR